MREATVYISDILSSKMPYLGSAVQDAFVKAGIRIKFTVDVHAFPEPIAPYEMFYCPKTDAYIVRQP